MLDAQGQYSVLRPRKSMEDGSPDNSSAARLQSRDVVLTPTPIDLQAEAGVLRGEDIIVDARPSGHVNNGLRTCEGWRATETRLRTRTYWVAWEIWTLLAIVCTLPGLVPKRRPEGCQEAVRFFLAINRK